MMWRKRFRIGLIGGVIGAIFMVVFALSAQAELVTQSYLDGIKHYEAQDFTEAIDAFTRVVESGVSNGKLFYNLANAHFKHSNLGPAILWYERARRLLPNDPDIRFNLDYASSLVQDEKETSTAPLVRILFFWKDLIPLSHWLLIGLFANGFFWFFWAAYRVKRKRVLKHISAGLLVLALVAAGIGCGSLRIFIRIHGIVPTSCRIARDG
ncbi:MAG: tetratricopeptide repeat protein [Deltaproteobacteria bacterium]|nr:tetratricopeptide repeat protein [Deltaproteobacteria bacterium]